MILSATTVENIYRAHFVKGRSPQDYLVEYNNLYELLRTRTEELSDSLFITFYPDDGDRQSMNYAVFSRMVYMTAGLLKSLGIGYQDRIATVSHNHINTVIQYFAAWISGITVVPVSLSEDDERIKYILHYSEIKLAFVHKDYFNRIDSLGIKELKLIKHGSGDNGFYENMIRNFDGKFEPDHRINRESEALIVYTSGTTGNPKGVVLTHYNLMADAYAISKWHGISRGDIMMCVLPIHHVNGTVVTLITPLYAGGGVVLNQKFHTDKFFERLSQNKVKIVSVVPTLLQYLCHDFISGKISMPELPNFSHVICGAGPLTCELAIKFEELFNLKIIHGYGLSETTCYSCFVPLNLSSEEHRKWLNDYGFPSIGAEIECNEMDIQNEDGKSLPENTRGEIVIRGHNVMKYYNAGEEVNSNTFKNGWFRSGDEGFYVIHNGVKYFFITGRIKELIIRGGINIAPLEIDEVLNGIDEVKAGIAVGFENDWYGEEVGALVIPADGLTQTEELKQNIIAKCRNKLPFFKCPKAVVFTDSIPVTSTGKYQRNKARYLFESYRKIQFRE